MRVRVQLGTLVLIVALASLAPLAGCAGRGSATLPSASAQLATDAPRAAQAVTPSPNYLGYISYYWGDPKSWTINCGAPTYFPPNTCLPVNASSATQLGGPALAVNEFVSISADPATASGKGITALSFTTSLTPFPGSPLPPGYTGPTPGPSGTPTPIPTASPVPTASATGPATPPSTNFLGYISYYWGDPKLWTINCGAPTYYPPNTCLPVTASGATQASGPALATGEFVAIYANPSTASSKGITAIVFATSLTPFAGSPLPPGYTGPTPGPSPVPSASPVSSASPAPSASPVPSASPKPTGTPTAAPTGPATPPSTNFLGYISYYWGDPKLWTINCGAPFYYPPNTCLPVTASSATQVSGPALATGEFVAIYANPSTANSKGITAIAFATSLTPFAGSPLPPGYTGPTPAPTASANPTPAPTASANPTPVPTPSGSSTLVDWPTYSYDVQRSGFNPYTTGITPASISQLHLAWQKNIGGAQTQPIVATNVAGHAALLIVATFDTARAFDALTGVQVWSHALPRQDVQNCGAGGISGTAQYDKALGAVFMAAGDGKGAPNHTILYRLDVATGAITGQVDVTPTMLAGEADYAHTGITLANGRIYLGTGSSCEGTSTGLPSWRGRVVTVDASSMSLLGTFFTTYGQGGNFGGGGVWAWGGVSADASGNIYAATGNAETPATVSQAIAAPFQSTTNEQAGYAEHLVKLSGDLSTVEGSNYPGFDFGSGRSDLDYAGTPVIYQPPLTSGCGLLSATQGKGGTLVINNAQTLAEVNSFALSVPSGEALYIGNPAYSPNTGYLYAAITSAGNGNSLLPPGLAAIGGCGASISWHAQFGPDSAAYLGPNPRSAPTVTAGGVVFIGTPCTSDGSGGCGAPGSLNGAVWAVDGSTGNVLGGGKPVLVTGDNIRMAPSADGLWVFVLDGSGNFYGLTVDPSVKAAALKPALHILSRLRIRAQ